MPVGATPLTLKGAWNDSDSLVVLGAGTMGSGVASVALQKGVAVRLRDISVESLKKGLAYIGKQIHQRFRKRECPENKGMKPFLD